MRNLRNRCWWIKLHAATQYPDLKTSSLLSFSGRNNRVEMWVSQSSLHAGLSAELGSGRSVIGLMQAISAATVEHSFGLKPHLIPKGAQKQTLLLRGETWQ